MDRQGQSLTPTKGNPVTNSIKARTTENGHEIEICSPWGLTTLEAIRWPEDKATGTEASASLELGHWDLAGNKPWGATLSAEPSWACSRKPRVWAGAHDEYGEYRWSVGRQGLVGRAFWEVMKRI